MKSVNDFSSCVTIGQLILNQEGKYSVENEMLKDYAIKMRLVIANFTFEDVNDYNCSAENSLGSSFASVKLISKKKIYINIKIIPHNVSIILSYNNVNVAAFHCFFLNEPMSQITHYLKPQLPQ